jgi:hypothetical protein
MRNKFKVNKQLTKDKNRAEAFNFQQWTRKSHEVSHQLKALHHQVTPMILNEFCSKSMTIAELFFT